jgi:hypothetical protein
MGRLEEIFSILSDHVSEHRALVTAHDAVKASLLDSETALSASNSRVQELAAALDSASKLAVSGEIHPAVVDLTATLKDAQARENSLLATLDARDREISAAHARVDGLTVAMIAANAALDAKNAVLADMTRPLAVVVAPAAPAAPAPAATVPAVPAPPRPVAVGKYGVALAVKGSGNK